MGPPLNSSSTAMSLGSREIEKERKRGEQKVREYCESKMINKQTNRSVSAAHGQLVAFTAARK